MTEVFEGRCHCGAVQWQAQLPTTIVLNCHCNMCRQLSGADYSSWVVIKDAQFTLLQGADQLQSYQASTHFSKTFCRRCATPVSLVNLDKFPGHTYVARGTVSTDIDLPVNLQVYTDDKACWAALAADIPVLNP